jgi:cytochrome c-type biogenesis protein CcmH/NrfG
MAEKKISGYVKSENVIWFVAVSLLIGFISGVAFGIYKTGTFSNSSASSSSAPPAVMNAEQQEAIDMLKAQTRKNPDDAASWIQLGHSYFDADQFAQAIAAYTKALAINPQNADVWTDMGVMYRRSGNPQKAVECFDRAIKADPKHQVSRFNKGVVLLHDLNDMDGALKVWESLLAIDPQAKTPSGEPLAELVDQIKNNRQDKK